MIGFTVGPYDHARLLVIDPTLVYSTYRGGTAADQALAVAVDGAGNAYVTGFTQSRDFPTTPGAYRTTYQGSGAGADAFVTKLNAAGTGLVYSTYLGAGNDGGADIVVDGAGNAYVLGATGSSNFPVTANVYQRTLRGAKNLFITKLNPAGNGLVFSTYLGGSGSDTGNGLDVDAAGNVYVAGTTSSGNFPVSAGAFQRGLFGATDGFVAKLNATGTALVYGTYLGGISSESCQGIAVDGAGNAYVTGYTYSSNFPTTPGAFQTYNWGPPAAFVTKLNAAGTGLVYSTFLGGGADEIPDDNPAGAIAVDAAGNAYVTGYTFSNIFPTTPGAYQTGNHGDSDAFVTKLNAAGTGLVYSTYLGGNSFDAGTSIDLDAAGNAYVTGYTISGSFPTTPGAFQTGSGGLYDAFLTKLNATGTALLYSTYLGGGNNDYGQGLAVDGAGDAYLAGLTLSTDFPTSATGFQRTNRGIGDGFVTKLSLSNPATHFRATAAAVATAGTAFNVTVTALDAQNNPAADYRGTVHFTSTDPAAVLPGDYTFTIADAGVHTFTATLKTAGGRTVTAGDRSNPSITGTAPVTVVPAATSVFAVAGFPSPVTAGTANTFRITAQDAYGNTTPGYTGTVHFTSSDPQAALPADYPVTAADAGVHTFSVTLVTAGTQSLTATDTANGSLSGTQAGIVVNPAAASTLTVAGFPSPIIAGVPGMVTVTARDPYGNIATGYRGTVRLTSSDAQAQLPAPYPFTAGDNGVHTFSAMLVTAGTQSLTATDTGTGTLTGTQAGIAVRPAVAHTLLVAGFPSPSTAGAAGTVTVTAQDAYGNTATDYVGTVHFASTDPQAALPADYTFTASDQGSHPFPAVLKMAGTQALMATDSGTPSLAGTQGGIQVVPAAADHLDLTAPASVPTHTPFALTVAARDPFGNLVTTYTGTVHFSSTDARAALPADYAFTPADAGQHTFSVTLATPGSQAVTAADTANPAVTGSATVTVTRQLFYPAVDYPVGAGPHAVAVADFTGDGVPDLAVANSDGNTITVLLGQGDGTFQAGGSLATDAYPLAVVVADVNGDGLADLVVANRDGGSLTIFLGNGDGSFQPAQAVPLGFAPAALAVADLNGDQVADLVTANADAGTISVLLNTADWPTSPGPGPFTDGGKSLSAALPSQTVPGIIGSDLTDHRLLPSLPVVPRTNESDMQPDQNAPSAVHGPTDAGADGRSETLDQSAIIAEKTTERPSGIGLPEDTLPEWALWDDWYAW